MRFDPEESNVLQFIRQLIAIEDLCVKILDENKLSDKNFEYCLFLDDVLYDYACALRNTDPFSQNLVQKFDWYVLWNFEGFRNVVAHTYYPEWRRRKFLSVKDEFNQAVEVNEHRERMRCAFSPEILAHEGPQGLWECAELAKDDDFMRVLDMCGGEYTAPFYRFVDMADTCSKVTADRRVTDEIFFVDFLSARAYPTSDVVTSGGIFTRYIN